MNRTKAERSPRLACVDCCLWHDLLVIAEAEAKGYADALEAAEAELQRLRDRLEGVKGAVEGIAYAGTSMPRGLCESDEADHYKSVAFRLIGDAARVLLMCNDALLDAKEQEG